MDTAKHERNLSSQSVWDMIYLIQCVIGDTKPDIERVSRMNQKQLYALASFHSLTALTGTALQGLDTGDMKEHWEMAINKAIRRTVLFDVERSALLSWMEEKKIWYMPLKGVILMDFYPVYGIRQMADNDILFDVAHDVDVRDWFVQRGYSVKVFAAGVHDSYLKEPIYNFEMHRMLFSPTQENWYAYYKNVKNMLIKDEGNSYGYHFSDEDFYIYFFVHATKHFTGGGTGLRYLIDLYLYTSKKTELDWAYIEGELEKLDLNEDEQHMRELAYTLFSRGTTVTEQSMTAEQHALLSIIISAGTYGTIGLRVKNTMQKKGWSKFQYMLNRFLVPISKKNVEYMSYACAYPVFYRYKILLPLLPFFRTFRAMKEGRFKAEAKAIRDSE